MPFIENNVRNVTFMTSSNIKSRHAFTTRLGGVSGGHLNSMNLGENRGDERQRVRGNYRLLGAAAGIDTSYMVFSKQVHGDTVRISSGKDARAPYSPLAYEADGLVTNVPGLPLIIFIADCVPVLMEDVSANVAAAVHCGWRSTALDILKNAVDAMRSLGAKPENIQAAIGPAISVCCFETGPEVPKALDKMLAGDSKGLFWPEEGLPGKYMTDLKGVCRRRLCQLGVPLQNISVSDECTKCSHEKYWSHRFTGGMRGSQAALITL